MLLGIGFHDYSGECLYIAAAISITPSIFFFSFSEFVRHDRKGDLYTSVVVRKFVVIGEYFFHPRSALPDTEWKPPLLLPV